MSKERKSIPSPNNKKAPWFIFLVGPSGLFFVCIFKSEIYYSTVSTILRCFHLRSHEHFPMPVSILQHHLPYVFPVF